jgi:hypothetical protein
MTLQDILHKTLFQPTELIKYLKCNLSLRDAYEQKIRHYTLEKHTLLVMNEFEKYFFNVDLPIRRAVFRLLLALHDIGKPQAMKQGGIKYQHQYTPAIIQKFIHKLPIEAPENHIIINLVNNDILGLYMQNKITCEKAKNEIVNLVAQTNLSIIAFFKLMTLYYQCDVGSYTADAGGLRYLEHLFEYQNNLKVLDVVEERLRFSQAFETKFITLKNLLQL